MFSALNLHTFALSLLATLAPAPLPVAQNAQPGNNPTSKKICYWVFLNRGKGRENFKGVGKEAFDQMQTEHIKNLTKLNGEGKALTAGPLGENGNVRGIVVLNLDEGVRVSDCFTEDPYIQNDLLRIESYRWLADASKFHKPLSKFRIGEITLGILKRGPKWTPPKTGTSEALPPLKSVASTGDLAISGELIEGKEKLEVFLFRSANRAKIKSSSEKEPDIKSGKYVLELHSQWLDPSVLRR